MRTTPFSCLASRLFARAAGALALLAVAAAPGTATAAPYFQGKTISILVGFGAGGGVDLNARIVAAYLGKHIAGNPTVIVKNMPGGSSTKMHNYLYEVAKGDGETIAYGPWFAVSQILKQPGIRFKYENFTLLGAWNTGSFIMYARKDIVPGGLKDPVQILHAKGLKVGGQNPFNSFDLRMRLSLALFGVPYIYVSGYHGSSNIRPAILRGEVNIGIDSTSGWNSVVKPTMVETGHVVPLWSFPVQDEHGHWVQSPSAFGIPNVIEIYKRAFHKAPSGDNWRLLELVLKLTGTASQLLLGPPHMNPVAAAEISKGWVAMAQSKNFLADYHKRFGNEPTIISKQATDEVMGLLGHMDPHLKALLKAEVESGMK